MEKEKLTDGGRVDGDGAQTRVAPFKFVSKVSMLERCANLWKW